MSKLSEAQVLQHAYNDSTGNLKVEVASVATAANQATEITSLSAIQAALGISVKFINRLDYTGTNVTTSAYVQLIASTSVAINHIEIYDNSNQTLVLAVGAAGSEVNTLYVIPGGNGLVPVAIAAGSRISIKAISASATTGANVMNFYG